MSPSARELADALAVPLGASQLQCLALVKLARLNGVAPLTSFTRRELVRLKTFEAWGATWAKVHQRRYAAEIAAAGPGWVRFFDGPGGRSVELTAAGWVAINAAEEQIALSREGVLNNPQPWARVFG